MICLNIASISIIIIPLTKCTLSCSSLYYICLRSYLYNIVLPATVIENVVFFSFSTLTFSFLHMLVKTGHTYFLWCPTSVHRYIFPLVSYQCASLHISFGVQPVCIVIYFLWCPTNVHRYIFPLVSYQCASLHISFGVLPVCIVTYFLWCPTYVHRYIFPLVSYQCASIHISFVVLPVCIVKVFALQSALPHVYSIIFQHKED